MKRLLCLLAMVYTASAEVPTAIAIHNARIIPVSGPSIERGTVVLRNGLIESVGASVNIPADAWIIEADGLTVYPGLIDALSSVGIPEPAPAARAAATPPAAPAPSANPPARGPEDRPNTTSWLRAADLVKLTDSRIETVRSDGFTTTVTFPMTGIFAGQGAVIDLSGDRPGKMVVAEPVGQYITLSSSGFGGGFPGSLMGSIAYIRQVYLDADHYTKARELYAGHPKGLARPEYDRALEGVLASPRILLPASRRVDVDRMLRFAAELKQPAILYGVPEGYHSADLIKKGGAPVLVNLKWPEKPADSDPDDFEVLQALEIHAKAPSTPAVLAKNGIKFAFYSGGITKRADLLKAIKRATDAGLSTDDALKAMTLAPAEIYGVADRVGSIEPGKIANLTITKGDFFDEKTKVQFVFVDGMKYEPVPEPPRPGNREGGEQP